MKPRSIPNHRLFSTVRACGLVLGIAGMTGALHAQSGLAPSETTGENQSSAAPAAAEEPVSDEPPLSQPIEDGSVRPIPLLIPFDSPAPEQATETDMEAAEPQEEQADVLPEEEIAATVSEADAFFTTFASGAMTSTAAGFPDRSYGFSGMPPGVPMGGTFADGALRGLSLSASLSGSYDSNPSQGYGAAGQSNDGDFSLSLGGNMAYRSTAARWTFGANYSGNYNQYFSESDYGGYNQRAGAAAYYDGGNLSATLSLGLNFGSGANRYYQAVVDEMSVSYNLSASYKLGPKATLNGYVSSNLTSASGGNSGDTDALSCGLTGFWNYSPRLSFGPGVRFTASDGDYQGGGRTSIGPTLNANYTVSERISLSSSVGMDFVDYENAPDPDSTWSGSLSANYRASDLWGLSLSLSRGVSPNPTNAGGFNESNSLRLGYNRKIRRASWTCGMSYETQDSETAAAGQDRTFWSFDTSLGMPIFADQVMGSIFFRYRDDGTSFAGRDTDSFSTGFSLSYSF